VKFGIRKPSLRKSLAARTSWKRALRHNLGMKAPRLTPRMLRPSQEEWSPRADAWSV